MAVNSRVRMRAMPSQNSSSLSLGTLIGLVHDAHRADVGQIFGAGGFHAGVQLGHHREGAVLAEGLHQRQRAGASHGNGQKRARVDDGVANREDGQFFDDRLFPVSASER